MNAVADYRSGYCELSGADNQAVTIQVVLDE